MLTLRRNHSESGFMSVESIANALFYLIMIAVVTMVASKVMQSGKIATTTSALSMLRSNIQYAGVNAGGYTEVGDLSLPQLIPGLVKDLATAAAGEGILPTGETIVVALSTATDGDEDGNVLGAADPNYFRMQILAPSAANCRKLAYYGLGAGFGVATESAATAGTMTIIDPDTAIADIEGACDGVDHLVLTSR